MRAVVLWLVWAERVRSRRLPLSGHSLRSLQRRRTDAHAMHALPKRSGGEYPLPALVVNPNRHRPKPEPEAEQLIPEPVAAAAAALAVAVAVAVAAHSEQPRLQRLQRVISSCGEFEFSFRSSPYHHLRRHPRLQRQTFSRLQRNRPFGVSCWMQWRWRYQIQI